MISSLHRMWFQSFNNNNNEKKKIDRDMFMDIKSYLNKSLYSSFIDGNLSRSIRHNYNNLIIQVVRTVDIDV